MNRFNYKQVAEGLAVFLDGKRVGIIKHTAGGFAYYPNGINGCGETFKTIRAVQSSIEKP